MKLQDDTTSTASVAVAPSVSSKTKKKKEKKDMELVTESNGYNVYKKDNKRVFEIKDEYDFQVFRKGLNGKDPRVWRGNDTCTDFLNDWNGNKSRSYSVRWNGSDVYPANMGF